MQKIIKAIKQTYQNWKQDYVDYKRLKEFEREFYKEFPKDDDGYNIIALAVVLGILLGIIIVSAIKWIRNMYEKINCIGTK